jgi:hypothetical protein
MILGPIQKAWIKALREHPELQTKGQLGIKSGNEIIGLCCLGQLGLIAGLCEWDVNGSLTVKGMSCATGTLALVFDKVGLRDGHGSPDKDFVTERGNRFFALDAMNDDQSPLFHAITTGILECNGTHRCIVTKID